MVDSLDLSGRVCLVTGGTSGLGQAIATGLAEAGATLVVGSSNPAKVEDAAARLGPGHSGVQLDVGDEQSVRDAVAGVVEQHGRIDGLVCAAGITHRAPPAETSLEDWERILRVNLTGTFLACREAGARMLAQEPQPSGDRGSIVTIASIQSFLAFEGTVAYAASKAAVAQLTRSLANDWSKHGVRVNSIAPGVFPTDLNRPLIEGTPRGEQALNHTPMGRFGRPEELVGAAVYLLSDAASYTTGAVLPVDGGFIAHGVG